MIALLRKEMSELWGLMLLAVFSVGFVAWAHFTLPLALHSGLELVDFVIEDITIIGSLAAFAAGHSRFGPEYQQKTIALLDALPTSRHRVFLVKLFAGALPSVLMVAGVAGVKAWALTAHPLPNGAATVPLVAVIALHVALLLALHYAAGLVLSWFGTVGWQALLVTGFCLMMATQIATSIAPWYPLIDGVVNLQIVDGWPVFPVGPLLVWAALSALGVVLAWILFLGPGDRIALGPWWIRTGAQILVYTPPVLLVLALVFASTLATAMSLPQLVRTTYRTETPHFRFLATWEEKESADALVARAESVRAVIVERFGVEGPARLDVELTGASEHLGGVFVPGKVQLRASADARILAHELSHAWSHHLGAPTNDPEAWRFFEEGLATYHEGAVGEPSAQAAVPAWGAPASDWFLAPEHGRRQLRFNPDEDYAVGTVWAEALVAVGGPAAPACVIRAAHDDPRGDRDGVPWWFELLASCGVDLADQIAAYEQRLPRDAPVPDLIAWHAGYDGSHRIRFTDPPAGVATVVCLARSSPRTPRTQYTMAYAAPGEICELSSFGLDPDRFQLAVGFIDPDDDNAPFRMGEWRTVTVP